MRPDRRRFVLADYCVERRGGSWFFGPPRDASATYTGPYGSVASVTLSIARRLRKEIERRDHREEPLPPPEQSVPF